MCDATGLKTRSPLSSEKSLRLIRRRDHDAQFARPGKPGRLQPQASAPALRPNPAVAAVIDALTRKVADFPEPGVQFKDLTPVFADRDAMAAITDALADACRRTLLDLGVDEDHITLVQVPGALEVPLALAALAERDEFDALIALGCIIRGETYHFELVANESGAGVTRVSLDYGIPIANAILTTEDLNQALARQHEKGRDAAYVAVEMAQLLTDLAPSDD